MRTPTENWYKHNLSPSSIGISLSLAILRLTNLRCTKGGTSVLPPVIDEGDISPFKFWFNNSIQDGMYYRHELYYRLHTADISKRAKVYHYACKMAQQSAIAVTASQQQCSIWVSLRGPGAKVISGYRLGLPPFRDFLADGHNSSESQAG